MKTISIELLSSNLKHYRQLANYTQKRIADKLNISRQVYNRYEQGKSMPDLNCIVNLCNIYNVPTDTFFTDSSNSTSILEHLEEKMFSIPDFIEFLSNIKKHPAFNRFSKTEFALIFYFNKLPKQKQREFLFLIFVQYLNICE